jgi:hypothetical protein
MKLFMFFNVKIYHLNNSKMQLKIIINKKDKRIIRVIKILILINYLLIYYFFKYLLKLLLFYYIMM